MRARVQWLTEEEGGRHHPPTGPWYSTVARFLDHSADWMHDDWSLVVEWAGERDANGSVIADVRFLVSDRAPQDWLSKGALFELYEGRERVAVGEVIE